MTLTIGSLFSGIGGLELGLERAGLGPVLWQCEIDPFCRRVLAKHWPTVTRFEDVTRPRDYPHVDLICGGFPCQDVSAAGRGRGIGGQRSGLWYHFARVVGIVRPSLVLIENVASGAKRWLPSIGRDLAGLGYRAHAYALSAFDVGAPHMRKRVFVLASDARGKPARGRIAEERVSSLPSAAGTPADAHRRGEPEPSRALSEEWRWSTDGSGWLVEPPVHGVAHGIPARLDRLRALGNAVVPQCAEAIGRMIMATDQKESADA